VIDPVSLAVFVIVLLTLGLMLALTGIVERARLFDIIAELCAQWSGRNGRLLFLFLYLFGALVTTFLSLDVTVILLTPIVLALTARRNIDPVPFLFATVFVANVVSLALPVSNLTNLLVYDGLGLDFRDFATAMWWRRTWSPRFPASGCCSGSSESGYPGALARPCPISRRSASPRRGPPAAGSCWHSPWSP